VAEGARLESVCILIGTEGSNPSLSAIIYHHLGRARWGVSGALYLQSAIAGLNSFLRQLFVRFAQRQVVLIIGSFATKIYEPRQIRKKAAVSRNFCVTRGCLIGANCFGNTCRQLSKIGARPFKY